MSTHAVVWIKSKDKNVFLRHNCDGDQLDTDIHPVLKKLPQEMWNVDIIKDKIKALEFGDSYIETSGVNWADEYIYVINVDKWIMTKYAPGLTEPSYWGDMLKYKTCEDFFENVCYYQLLWGENKSEEPGIKSIDESKEHWTEQFFKQHNDDLKKIIKDIIKCGYIDGYNTVLQAYMNLFGVDDNYEKLIGYLNSKNL